VKKGMIIHPDELSVKWVDRLADGGVEVLGIHPCGGQFSFKYIKEMLALIKTAEYRRLIDYAKARGLEIEYELHGACWLLPRELFDTHPEYFRENEKGERTGDYNFCVSNEEALELAANRAAELALLLYGSNNNFYFWMDDGHGIHCHCEKCRRLSPSDQQLLALNAFIRAIRREIPEAKLSYLAYMDSIGVPERVSPEEGIFLEYAPFEKYTAKGEDAPDLIKREKEMILPLMRFFGGEKKLLEYWFDNSMFSNWQKPPRPFKLNREGMKADLKEYKKDGFDYVSTFACFLGEDYETLYGEVDITPFAKG